VLVSNKKKENTREPAQHQQPQQHPESSFLLLYQFNSSTTFSSFFI
jgi:hypothetical protein